MKKFLLLSFTWVSSFAIEVNQVVIWGHKLHSHTHSYIHEAFFRAFQDMGYKTYWFDDDFTPKDFDFSKTLFFTASNVDKNIPLREDAYYIFHHCWNKEHRCAAEKYGSLIEQNRCISIKCFWSPYLKEDPFWIKVAPFIYKSLAFKELVFPWATDLLPQEIDEEIRNLGSYKVQPQVTFVGTVSDSGLGSNSQELTPFFEAAKKLGLKIFTNDPWARPISSEKHKKLIQSSLFAPSIQGAWQRDNGYIPCRIFKNISYGKLGITNSRFVYDFFGQKIIYDTDTEALFTKSYEALKTHSLSEQIELMEFIRDYHTYKQRIELILNFFEEINYEDD